MQRLRIPSKVYFPFGYTITVRQVTDKDMTELAPDCDAYWNVGTRTICIRKALSIKRRIYLLGHEMTHALADFQHEFMDSGEAKP